MADWELCSTAPGAASEPADLDALAVEWLPAVVPGTAAGALRALGRWSDDDEYDFDAEDWWWRTTFTVEADDTSSGSQLVVAGLATIADVWFAGRHVLHSENMFRTHRVDLGALAAGSYDVVIRCAALAPLL